HRRRPGGASEAPRRVSPRRLYFGRLSPRQELANALRNLLGVRFQREMPGVEKLNHRGRIVAGEGLRPDRQKKGIVPPPYGQQRRFIRPKVLLEGRIERDVALVVTEEIQLNFIRSGSCEVEVVEVLAVGRDQRRVPHALRVLPACRLGAQEGSQHLAILFGRVLPIRANRLPAITEPLLVGVPVLRNDRSDAIRMASGNAEAGGRAVVENVEGETIEA